MRKLRICSFLFAIFLVLVFSPAAESYSATADLSTTWTTNYSAVNPILRRESNVAVFTCGFFCEDNCTSYYFAIFISPTTESPGQYKHVWSAKKNYDYLNPTHRENPILNFTAAGDLVLEDVDGFIYWKTDTAGKSVAGMNLTDTGNLVLFDHRNSVVWQSFDDPTDSLLPGQKLFQGQELQSRDGASSLQLTDKGLFGYAYYNELYYRWLVYGKGTNKGRRYMKFSNGSLSICIEYSSEPSDPVGVIGIPEASSAQYMKLMPDGHLQVFEWQLEEWKVIKDLTTLFQSYSYTANLSTTWNTNYSYAQPILFTETNGTQFACGFLCEGNCTNGKSLHHIFAVFIYPTTYHKAYKVVWSANRDYPVRENSILNFTSAGDLVLKDGDGSIVWTTNTAGKSVAGMNLTETGNLVLFDNQNSVVWQSFDHPTDSLLPGQKLYQGQKLKSSVSLSNSSGQEVCHYSCSCAGREHFRPVNDRQPNLGCSEITPLTCNSTQDQDLIKLENVKYFTSTADMEGVNMETCKQACRKNCSCKAAFYQYYSHVSSGDCFLLSELFTMKTVDPLYYNASAFIKVQYVTSHRLPHQVARLVGYIVGSFVLLLVVALGVVYVFYKRKRDIEMEEENLDQLPGMPNRYSYEELKTATENFSKKLGEGGFGTVFEGTLRDGTKIAVKCLEGLAHVKKSFLAEVQSIGSIHHVNLVRLRGFCTWKSQRFLVYDFMSNGSLDSWIYLGVRKRVLEWECRKKIILDIAKGLAYLHEECRQKIVHLDIKPQNILLDSDFSAKVSDFGLSKLIDKNQSEVMTNIKGTPGYLAPEWRSSIITEKVDVYSFGIVLLEILCGRKVLDRSQPEESGHLLFVFEKSWEQGTLLDMVDRQSEDMRVHSTEVVEMMKVAAWCLQTNFKRRPSMSSVVKVLEGGMGVESKLDYNFIDPIIQETEDGDGKYFTQLSASLLSGPR
ncbi:G-type lectin S-receptor-like serine/threonine-protein kinase SD2-5 [Helianthus annuus]|uniref:G-type lectin S-receptor-like serine/threonine-protein kinase SD2-5 n=1 Tax=Helianthus annuus TaxID=4232 RepID=UPI000B8F49A9|nr:G-type lectin S-receptor-like serine/threonine-protein kinase SD2-5 [Helianthus annuus]